MNKILGVALVGGVLLGGVLYATRDRNAADPAAATNVSVPAATAPAAPAPPPATTAAPVVVTSGDATACARLSELCSTSDQKVDAAECAKQLADARKMAGPANVERSEQCLADAKTCAAASGCMSGGVGMGAMGEFLKGLGGALSR